MELLEHVSVLAAHRAVHHCGAGSLTDRSGCPYPYGAIDDCQYRLIELEVPNSLTNKVVDLERIAYMQDINLLDPLDRRCNVYSDHLMLLG